MMLMRQLRKNIFLLLFFSVINTGVYAVTENAEVSAEAVTRKNAKVIKDTVYQVIRDTVYITLPIKNFAETQEMIKTPAVGRFDRGIANYKFMPKGKWLFGTTASYSNFDSNDIRILSIVEGFNCNARTYGFNPFIGYFYRNNMMVGAKFGYEHLLGDLSNLSIDIDEDMDFSLSDIYYSEDLYSMAVIHRSYVGLDAGKRFGLFSETSLSYKTGSSYLVRGADMNQKKTETEINEFQLNMSPGVCVYIMQNVSVEMSFGIMGIKYRVEEQKMSNGEIGKHRDSGANFKINLFNINLGITVCM